MACSAPLSSDPRASSWRRIAALALAHGANDMYIGFLPALLPLIVDRLDLSYKAAGLLVSIVMLTSQFPQPLFGFLGDRIGRRGLAVAGPAVTALSMSAVGLLDSYWSLLAVLIIAALGTAAFHPHGAAMVGALARRPSGGLAPARASSAMALFTAGGNAGYGLGPVVVIAVVSRFGLACTWLTLAIGIAAVAYLIFTLPRRTEAEPRSTAVPAPRQRPRWIGPLIILFCVVMLRAAAATLFTTFAPLLIVQRGEALILGGWTLLGFALAGALGGLVGGPLSDHIGRPKTTVLGLALAAPALYFFLHAHGLAAAALLFASGACLFSALPVNIVMGQELLPRHASTISGVVMGFAWGVGGLATTALGTLVDHLAPLMGELAALERAMEGMALLPLAAALLACALPETRPTEGS